MIFDKKCVNKNDPKHKLECLGSFFVMIKFKTMLEYDFCSTLSNN